MTESSEPDVPSGKGCLPLLIAASLVAAIVWKLGGAAYAGGAFLITALAGYGLIERLESGDKNGPTAP